MAEKWRGESGGMDEDMPDVELEELQVKEKVLTLLASFKSNSYRVNILLSLAPVQVPAGSVSLIVNFSDHSMHPP